MNDSRGRFVRVAIIDSGVHAAHPHVGGAVEGMGFDDEGRAHENYVDRLGHGTAVAAVIREKAPDAELICLKVFERELAATTVALVAAIRWAVERQADLINLSLGTSNPDAEPVLAEAVHAALSAGARIIAAAPEAGVRWLPGALDGVIGVELDWAMPRHECDLAPDPVRGPRARASGFPRPIPGVPPERNLQGLSFAVANVTGLLARAGAGPQPG
jgi:hypothetical protein